MFAYFQLDRMNSAIDYLKEMRVVVVEQFDSDSNVFLWSNHKAEVDVVSGVRRLLRRHEEDPIEWEVELNGWVLMIKSPPKTNTKKILERQGDLDDAREITAVWYGNVKKLNFVAAI